MHNTCEGSRVPDLGSQTSGRSGRVLIAWLAVAALLLAAWCRGQSGPAAVTPTCDNEALTAYDGLLVLAPHPDDEVLAFGGLIAAYMRLGKPVSVVVVTDGIRYRMYDGRHEFTPLAYANLARLKRPALDLFERMKRP